MLTWNMVMAYHYWISKLLWQKLWLVDRVIVRDCSPPVGKAREKLMKYPYPEKFQPRCLSFSLLQKGRLRSQRLCPARHVTCIYICLKRETAFWSIICSFPSQLHCLLNAFLNIDYSCVYFLVSSYHKYCVFYIVEYA